MSARATRSGRVGLTRRLPHGVSLGGKQLPLLIVVCLMIVIAAVVCTILGDAIAPKDPASQALADRSQPPGDGYLLGTDAFGRDVLSRVIAGTRIAVVGPAMIALAVLVVGSAMGIVAGYLSRWLDAAFMRWADFTLAVPHLLIILVVVGIIGGGYLVAVLLMILFLVPYGGRLVRGQVLQQRQLPYVEAAEALGLSRWRIMFGHLLPNVAPLAVSTAFWSFAISLVALSSLSFLGVGVPPGTADWGRMLFENLRLVYGNPWAPIAPGLAIVLTAASMNVLGDWLFEALTGDA